MSEQHEKKKAAGFLRRNGWTLVLAALLGIAVAVTGWQHSHQEADLDAQEAQISQLSGQVQDAQAVSADAAQQVTQDSWGIDPARVSGDSGTLTDLVSTIFTWSSAADYDQARTDLADDYGLDPKSDFLTTVMPAAVYSEDSAGTKYYYLDTMGANSAVGYPPQVQVEKVSADKYTYLVLVDVATTNDAVDQNDSGSASVTEHRSALLTATIDATGAVSGLDVAMADGATRSSD